MLIHLNDELMDNAFTVEWINDQIWSLILCQMFSTDQNSGVFYGSASFQDSR